MTKATRAAFETMQFFEMDLPEGMTAEEFMETPEFRDECAEMVKNGLIGFQVERLFDEEGNEI